MKKKKNSNANSLKSLEKSIGGIINICELNLTVEELKEIVFEENGHKEYILSIGDFIGSNEEYYDVLLGMFNDAWNYFPHKSLGGKSPAEKMAEYEKDDNNLEGVKKSNRKDKLTKKDIDLLWGGDGPYSEVRLLRETRILDDRVSRVFVIVEMNFNPTTFELVNKSRNNKEFKNEADLQSILDGSQYGGPEHGYIAVVFSKEYSIETEAEAEKVLQRMQSLIIKMHKFVMKKYLS